MEPTHRVSQHVQDLVFQIVLVGGRPVPFETQLIPRAGSAASYYVFSQSDEQHLTRILKLDTDTVKTKPAEDRQSLIIQNMSSFI
jgi:hypothetical protein